MHFSGNTLIIYLFLSRQLFSEMVSRRDMVPTPFDAEFSREDGKRKIFRKFETVRKRGSKFEKFEFRFEKKDFGVFDDAEFKFLGLEVGFERK